MKKKRIIMKKGDHLAAMLTLALSLFWAGASYSADADSVLQNQGATRPISDKALAQAKAYSNPLPPPDASRIQAETAAAGEGLTPGAVAGSLPALTPSPTERAFGTFGIPYTSTRVALGSSNQTSAVGGSYLSSTFPYRTIGKLTFSAGYCSASLI